MRILIAFILFLAWCAHATTYTEFYCDTSNGSTNINAGSTTNATPVYSSVNGNWDGTSVYTPTDGSTPANTVSAGMWAAIFIDGSTNLVQTSAGGCVMLITNVAAGANGAITFERSAFMGTAPSSSATGRSINVGGCWNGPYRTIGFPFAFATNTGTNGPQAIPRINFRNTAQYDVTAAMSHNSPGPIRLQGMTASPGDGGRATIDGGTSGGAYTVFTLVGVNTDLVDMIFSHNGSTSTGSGVSISGNESMLLRVVVHDMLGRGINTTATSLILEECEVYGNNATGGMLIGGSSTLLIRCIAHDSTSGYGFSASNPIFAFDCIAESNGGSGFILSSVTGSYLYGCTAYNNGGSGIDLTGSTSSSFLIENSSFFKNTAYGITSSGSSLRNGMLDNCVFGSGTQTNASGNIASNLGGINEISTITYTSDQTPWEDPANGDFRLSSGATLVKAAGRGSFTQTAASYTGTVSYPDIGSAQVASTNAAPASGGAHTWAQ